MGHHPGLTGSHRPCAGGDPSPDPGTGNRTALRGSERPGCREVLYCRAVSTRVLHPCFKKDAERDFLGGPVAETLLPMQGSIPGRGARPHMPQRRSRVLQLSQITNKQQKNRVRARGGNSGSTSKDMEQWPFISPGTSLRNPRLPSSGQPGVARAGFHEPKLPGQ